MDYQYTHNDTSHSIDLTVLDDNRYKARIGDREIEFSARPQGDDTWIITLHHQRIVGTILRDGDMRYLHINGKTWTLSAVDERTSRRKQTGSAGDLTAQMPGQVVEVSVKEGDAVKSGQTLVILEAMKMEIRVTAPADGVVHAIFVEQGDIVQRGQSLIEVKA